MKRCYCYTTNLSFLFTCQRAVKQTKKFRKYGPERDRTADPLLAKQVLSQLSYRPETSKLVGPSGFEPLTPALSAQCSNQLSYGPEIDPLDKAGRSVLLNY